MSIKSDSSEIYTGRFEKLLLVLVLAIAAVMRLYHLGEISLSNDELSAMFRANYQSFSDMIQHGVLIDYHPAGVQIFIFYWLKCFGNGVFLFRLPFVILSLLSVYWIYLIGKKWFHPAVGLWSAALFAVLEYPLLYSMLARMYSPGLFFSLMAVNYWTNWIKTNAKQSQIKSTDKIGLFTAIAMGVHTHYFTVAFLFSVVVAGLLLIRKRYLLSYLLICGIAASTFLLEWNIFLEQMKTGDLGGWLGKPEPTFILEFFFNLMNNSKYLLWTIAGLFSLGLIFGRFKVRLNKYHLVAFSWFTFSYLLAYLYSIYRHPALQYSTLLFCIPYLFMAVIAVVPQRVMTDRITLVVLLLLLSSGAFSTVVEKEYYSKPPFGVFKQVAGDLTDWTGKYGEENIGAVVNVISPDYINYYLKQSSQIPKSIRFKVESVDELAVFREYLDSASVNHQYFAFVWTNNLHPYEILSIIKTKYPCVKEFRSYYNAESWLFSKDSIADQQRQWRFDFEDASSGGLIVSDSSSYSGKGCLLMNEQYEYSPGLDVAVKLSEDDFKVFSCSVFYKSMDTAGKQTLVFEVLKDGNSMEWYGIELNKYNLHPGKWQQVFLARPLPEVEGKVKLKAYVWNPDHKTFLVDNMLAKLDAATDPYSRK